MQGGLVFPVFRKWPVKFLWIPGRSRILIYVLGSRLWNLFTGEFILWINR